MGFKLSVTGGEKIELGLESILSVEFMTDTPDDSNARSTDLGTTLCITGKILALLDGATGEDNINMAKWSLVPAEQANCYRNVKVEVISASQVVRRIELPNAFVVDYAEEYGDTEGVGTFKLLVRQKKDKTKDVKFEGGFQEN